MLFLLPQSQISTNNEVIFLDNCNGANDFEGEISVLGQIGSTTEVYSSQVWA